MTSSSGPNPWTEKVWSLSDVRENGDHFAADESEYLANNVTNNDNNTLNYYDSSEEDDNDVIFDAMRTFCHAINEPHLVEKFLRHKVTLAQLLEFDEQDLIACGIDLVGERKKILHEVAQAHSEKWMPTSLKDLTGKSLLSSPGIYSALNDINRHLEYIGVTFRYLRRRIQKSPNILELGKDHCGVAKISEEIEDLMKTTKSTYTQLQALDHQVCKHLDDPILKPANHIDSDYVRRAKIRLMLFPTIVGCLFVGASVKILMILNRSLHLMN